MDYCRNGRRQPDKVPIKLEGAVSDLNASEIDLKAAVKG
jgi:hypothetical protein